MKKINSILMFKITIGLLVFVILLELLNILFNNNISELRNEYIDSYNFRQLKKVKIVLDKLDKNSYNFGNLKQFNEEFNQNIKSIKNCYFLADRNRFYKDNKGGGGYILGFKLESGKYINKYGTGYYVYPKYDLPVENIYFGLGGRNTGGKKDRIYDSFIETISNPCRD